MGTFADGPKVVLVVEDDADIRSSLETLLKLEGYAVRLATNGQEALDALAQKPHPCIVLLDLMMPVKDGFQFAQERKAIYPELNFIPTIVMSADGHVREKQTRAGAQAYLRKPVDVEELLLTVANLCSD
jgi:CheY-like chemotaxis protein